MNKDQVEGKVRSVIGEGEKAFGEASNDTSMRSQGVYDSVAVKAQTALGSIKDSVASGAGAIATTRDQLAGAMNSATDNLNQAASAAQDKFVSLESEMEARIKNNPWIAVGIAAFIGVLIGKMT